MLVEGQARQGPECASYGRVPIPRGLGESRQGGGDNATTCRRKHTNPEKRYDQDPSQKAPLDPEAKAKREEANKQYAERRNKAWSQCYDELCLPKEWLEDRYESERYIINSKTGQPTKSFSLPIERVIWITSGEYKKKTRKGEDNYPAPFVNKLTVDKQVFSRDRFYKTRDFENAVIDYYEKLQFGAYLRFQRNNNRWYLNVNW